MISPDITISRKKNIISKKINDEYILISLTENVADMNSLITLNETAAFLWDNIDGTKNINQLAEAVAEEYDVDAHDAFKDTTEFISKIKDYIMFN